MVITCHNMALYLMFHAHTHTPIFRDDIDDGHIGRTWGTVPQQWMNHILILFSLCWWGATPLKIAQVWIILQIFWRKLKKMKSWNHQIVNQLNLKHTNLLLHTSSLLSFEKTHDSFSGSGSPRRLFCLVTWRICVSIYIYTHTFISYLYLYIYLFHSSTVVKTYIYICRAYV